MTETELYIVTAVAERVVVDQLVFTKGDTAFAHIAILRGLYPDAKVGLLHRTLDKIPRVTRELIEAKGVGE